MLGTSGPPRAPVRTSILWSQRALSALLFPSLRTYRAYRACSAPKYGKPSPGTPSPRAHTRLGHHPGKMIKLLFDHLDHLRETKDLFSPTPFRWVAKRQKAPKNIKF